MQQHMNNKDSRGRTKDKTRMDDVEEIGHGHSKKEFYFYSLNISKVLQTENMALQFIKVAQINELIIYEEKNRNLATETKTEKKREK